eukprot:1159500-Pelagomonas_calceolata.AAC.7
MKLKAFATKRVPRGMRKYILTPRRAPTEQTLPFFNGSSLSPAAVHLARARDLQEVEPDVPGPLLAPPHPCPQVEPM